jgi:predicted DNA-binding transcriptional regulator AlpA
MEKLLTSEDVAEMLGIGPETFGDMRRAGDGPPVIKLGHRTLRYRPADVDAWLISRQNAA